MLAYSSNPEDGETSKDDSWMHSSTDGSDANSASQAFPEASNDRLKGPIQGSAIVHIPPKGCNDNAALHSKDDNTPTSSLQSKRVLAIDGLSCSTRDGKALVRDLDLSITSGSSLLIVGPSGVGKTTLLQLMAGLWPADAGSISMTSQVDLVRLKALICILY